MNFHRFFCFVLTCLEMTVIGNASQDFVVYQPECTALDVIIDNIENFECIKNDQCNAITCKGSLQSQEKENVEIILTFDNNCDDPPSVTIHVNSNDLGFDESYTVNRSQVIELPPIILGEDTINYKLDVVTIESVDKGMKFRMNLGWKITTGNLSSQNYHQTFIREETIPLPPCDLLGLFVNTTTRPDPVTKQCSGVDNLTQNIHERLEEFKCQNNTDCLGFNCTGYLEDIDVTMFVRINNCDSPPGSLTVFGSSQNYNISFQHNYVEQYEKPLIVSDVYKVYLEVEKKPVANGTMITTMNLIGCSIVFTFEICPSNYRRKILVEDSIPVPPCNYEVSSTSTQISPIKVTGTTTIGTPVTSTMLKVKTSTKNKSNQPTQNSRLPIQINSTDDPINPPKSSSNTSAVLAAVIVCVGVLIAGAIALFLRCRRLRRRGNTDFVLVEAEERGAVY